MAAPGHFTESRATSETDEATAQHPRPASVTKTTIISSRCMTQPYRRHQPAAPSLVPGNSCRDKSHRSRRQHRNRRQRVDFDSHSTLETRYHRGQAGNPIYPSTCRSLTSFPWCSQQRRSCAWQQSRSCAKQQIILSSLRRVYPSTWLPGFSTPTSRSINSRKHYFSREARSAL